MDNEQISLNINKGINIAMLSTSQVNEINKLKKQSIVFDSTRILICASIIGLLQLLLQGNVVNEFLFLTGATHLLSNSLFPELVSGIAIIAEGMAKLLGGIFLNNIYKNLFSKTKKYNNEKELIKDIINKEIEEDMKNYIFKITGKFLEKSLSNNQVGQYGNVASYEILKLEEDEIREKLASLRTLVTKRKLIKDYIQTLSYKNDLRKDKNYLQLRLFGYIFWLIQIVMSDIFLAMMGLEVSSLLKIITYFILLFGCDKIISYKNSNIMEVIEEKKIKIDGFNMPENIEILKRQYKSVNQELETKVVEITDLYYDYWSKRIAIEGNGNDNFPLKENKKAFFRGIAPIDRSLETEPIVAKSRILRREDNE